nr:hypothetical protein [Rhizobium sophoriradicis]
MDDQHLPKKGAIVEVNNWGQPELPKKAERVYGKPGKGDQTGLYLDPVQAGAAKSSERCTRPHISQLRPVASGG